MSLRPAESPATEANARTRRAKLHPDVLKLGLVSFLTDLSSEMIFSVFAVFFTTVAGCHCAYCAVDDGVGWAIDCWFG